MIYKCTSPTERAHSIVNHHEHLPLIPQRMQINNEVSMCGITSRINLLNVLIKRQKGKKKRKICILYH